MRTASVRGRAAFDALRRQGRRSRRRALQVTHVPGSGTPAVAYAIGRPVGSAVVRNRLRRRLRAIVAGLDLPGGTYLVWASPAAPDLSFAELEALLTAAVADVTGRPAAS